MPGIYSSFKFEPSDDLETRRKKLYLGIITLGEQLYSFNAAVNELRKEFTVIDQGYKTLKAEYEDIGRAQFKRKKN